MASFSYEIFRAGSAATDVGLHVWLRHFILGGGPLVVLFALGQRFHLTGKRSATTSAA